MSKLRVLDLFSGVGAYSLGLERTGGFQTVAFCELEEYPRKILRKHWPDVRIYEDVRDLTASRLAADGIVPQWIVAGWPCQDISVAGTGSGLDGARSGLWGEIARLASELGLEGLLLENSSNLLSINGGADFGRVLGDLAALGFDAEWHCLPAAAFDAPHIRDRLWIVAHASNRDGKRGQLPAERGQPAIEVSGGDGAPRRAHTLADADEGQRLQQNRTIRAGRNATDDGRSDVSDAAGDGRREGQSQSRGSGARAHQGQELGPWDGGGSAADANSVAPVGSAIARAERHTWIAEPGMGRVVAGCPNRVDRIRALGNLNPPVVPEAIGRAILEAGAAA